MSISRASMTVECEAKLGAPENFELPELSGLVGGVIATPMATRRLDAVYYDTTDLRLARSGVTLRCRSGEPGPPWTLKLPQAKRDSSLTRTEIGFEGPHTQIPEAAIDLVAAISRGRRLGPVCRLSTSRDPIQFLNSDGRLLAELVNDTVTASSGRHRMGEFREVEIEVYSNERDANRLLRKSIRRLTAAGCEASSPTPKLIRALGTRAAQPADVTVTALSSHPVVSEVIQHAIARSVSQIIRHDPGVRLGDDPEDVHQLRVGARRLRSDLRAFSPLLDQQRTTAIRAEMGWLGDVVGHVRDADVLAMRLHQDLGLLPEEDRRAGESLLHTLEDQRFASRQVMLAAMRSRRYLRTLDDLVALAASPPLVADTDLDDLDPIRVAARLVRKSWKALSAAVHRLGDDPSDIEIHRVRILAKHCRYAAEAVTPLAKPHVAPFAAGIADIQTFLGDYQDSVVAQAWLRETAEVTPTLGIAAGQIIALERLHREQLRNQWREVWKRVSSDRLHRWL